VVRRKARALPAVRETHEISLPPTARAGTGEFVLRLHTENEGQPGDAIREWRLRASEGVITFQPPERPALRPGDSYWISLSPSRRARSPGGPPKTEPFSDCRPPSGAIRAGLVPGPFSRLLPSHQLPVPPKQRLRADHERGPPSAMAGLAHRRDEPSVAAAKTRAARIALEDRQLMAKTSLFRSHKSCTFWDGV